MCFVCCICAKSSIYVHCSGDYVFPGNNLEFFRINLHHSGRIKWSLGGVVETTCDVDGRLFPFDSQSCSIVVGSWAYNKASVDLTASKKIHLSGLNDDGELRHLV